MDNMATGFAFGMAGEDFANIDFHSMAGDGEGAQPSSLIPGLNQFTPFNPALTRDAMYSQASIMPPRTTLDLPRFSAGHYEGNNAIPSANFNALMPSRHAYPGFGEMYAQHLSGSDTRAGEGERMNGMTDAIADHMGSYGNVMSPPSSSSPNIMPSSMPVFPNTPSNMIHGAMSAQNVGREHEEGDQRGMKAGAMQSSSHGYKSPVNSPRPALQTCFPGSLPSLHVSGAQSGGMMSPSHGNPSPRYKEERDFSGGPSDPISSLMIGNEVTPMQSRRRNSPRRSNMLAQEVAAAASAALAIETKQVPMPPMLSPRESHLLGAISPNMNYPPSMAPPTFNSSHCGYLPHTARRGRRPRSVSGDQSVYQVHYDHPVDAIPSSARRRTVVPFFKAGALSVREPEMFEGAGRRAPLVTQATQTGHDPPSDPLAPHNRPVTSKDARFSHVNPTDGKGGFPLFSNSNLPPLRQLSMPTPKTPSEHIYKGFIEGEGYAKRGNSKTVVSPSFGEAAGRAVVTTSVGDHSTVVTVTIMGRNSAAAKTKLSSSLLSPRPSTSHEPSDHDDLKENLHLSPSENVDPSDVDGTTGVQTRRGRRSVSINANTMPPTTSSRGRTLRRRTNPDNVSIQDHENFDQLIEERKEKARAHEQERMEISIRIEDSQCISIGDQKRWHCELCSKSYTTKHNLVMHMLDHNGIKPHLCLVCGKYFKQLSHLNTHMLTHDKVRPHVCNSCGKGFTQISHLKRHLAVHAESKPYSCDECGRGFAFPSELRIHKDRHANGRIVDHTCEECGEEFPNGSQLRQHEMTHDSKGTLSCNYCSRTFRYPSQLKDHAIIHSNSRPYMCTECGMDFMKEHHLRSHQFTHTGLRPYSCSVCGRAFNQRANMLRHMLIHKSERSYKCEFCEKSFTQPQTLKAHMVVHADHKPYQCNLCGKEFGRLHNLHGHMHMHNNSKPYVCFCGSSFTLKGNLNRHKKVKHGLNESTENMEEDAVHFLSSWSERARGERSGDEAHEDGDLNGQNATLDGAIDGHDMDTSLDVLDKSSSRKQRKSTPRKIPRHSASGKKRQGKGNGDDDMDDDDEVDEDFEDDEATLDQYPMVHFHAEQDNAAAPELGNKRMMKESKEEKGEGDPVPKRSRRERNSHYNNIQNGDYASSGSDSEKDDGARDFVDDDCDWVPGAGPKKNGKGAKLDSLIAEKFKSS